MADKKSAKYPFQWADGTWHSISQQQHQFNLAAANRQPVQDSSALLSPTGGATTMKGTQAPFALGTDQAPPPTPQPFDPQAELARITAGRNVALGNAESAYQQGNLTFDYGYNADGSQNTANPYSRAAMLRQAYDASRLGTTNSLAAQGQLYSGAMANAQGRNDRNYAQGEAAGRLAFTRSLHGIQSGKLANYAGNAAGVGAEDFNALLRATYGG